jgi:hypothetical protein
MSSSSSVRQPRRWSTRFGRTSRCWRTIWRVEAIELFREVNERVRDANEMLQHQEGEALFLCECARQDCTERLTVSLGAYEEVRQVPTHFLVAAGHEHVFPDAERLFETHTVTG